MDCPYDINGYVAVVLRDDSHHSLLERSGSVEECLTPDREAAGFEPHRRHCIVVLEQDTFILA